MKVWERVYDVLYLVHDLAVRRVLRRTGLQVLYARLNALVNSTKRDHFVVDLRIHLTRLPHLIVDRHHGGVANPAKDVLHAGFLDGEALDAHVQLTEHTLALLSILRVNRDTGTYLVHQFLSDVSLGRHVSHLVVDVQRDIYLFVTEGEKRDRLLAVFAEHFVDFEIDRVQFVARAIVAHDILAYYGMKGGVFTHY